MRLNIDTLMEFMCVRSQAPTTVLSIVNACTLKVHDLLAFYSTLAQRQRAAKPAALFAYLPVYIFCVNLCVKF